MRIDGSTALYVVIGDPVSAVRSPEVFNAWFEAAGRNAVLVPLHVGAQDFAAAMAGLKAMRNLQGIVVTMPHKASACAHADVLGPMARATGALNTMRRGPDSRWEGEMFDGRGFVEGARTQGIGVRNLRIHLVGAGAAGSAVALALADAGVASLQITDSDGRRAQDLAARVLSNFPAVRSEVAPVGSRPAADMIVNATPLGMRPDDPLPFDPATAEAGTIVADIVTKPETTRLLALAREAGHRTLPGRHMHEGQARLAAAFFGFDSPEPRVP